MNRTFSKLGSLMLVLVMLMTTAMPLLSSNVSGGAASEGSAPLPSVGPDGKPYKDPADYTVVPAFDIDFADAVNQGINEIQYLTAKTLSYTDNDDVYHITGDGSPEDPFVVKDLWFEGNPDWQGRFVWQGVLYNWVFINCVFESQVTLNANRDLRASGSIPTALSFQDCTFYSVPAGIEVSQSGAGLSLSNNYWGDPLGTATLTFKNNAIINIDPFTGITGANALGLQISASSSTFATATIEGNFIDGGIQTSVNTRVIVQNNTLLLNSAKPTARSGDLYLNGCSNGTIVSNNSVASITPVVSAAGVTVRIYDNTINGEGKKASGIDLTSSTPNNLNKDFYVYNNAISNTTGQGILGNLAGGGTIHVYSNYFENTKLGFKDNQAARTVIERFDNNTFVNAWSSNTVVTFDYESVVKVQNDIPISWTYRSFIASSVFASSEISSDNGTSWTPTGASSTAVDLGAEERWYNFLLSVTDTEDNEFIESIDIAHDLSPPVVTFIAPMDGKTLRTNTLRIFYETTDLTGATKANIKLDDREWIGERATYNGYTITAAQGASRGAHTLTVYVEDSVGNAQECSINFVFRPMGEETVFTQENIVIDGDDELAGYAHYHGLAGNGTSGDPYVLKGLNLDCDGGVGITLVNTTKHLVIYDIEFFNGAAGVILQNADNVTVEECIFHNGIVDGVVVFGGRAVISNGYFTGCDRGVVIEDVDDATIAGGSFLDCGTGIDVLTDAGTLIIEDNLFERAGEAIELNVENVGLNVIGNEISLSEFGIIINSTASTVNVSGNVISHSTTPFAFSNGPDVFSDNLFELNDQSMVQFTSPPDGKIVGGLEVECEYDSRDLSGNPFVSFEASNDQIAWTSAGTSSHVFDLGKEGVNTLYLRSTDADGNSVITSMTVVRDTTPPTVTIVLPQNELVLKADFLPFRWAADDVSGISSVMVKLGNGGWTMPDTMNGHIFSVLGLYGSQTLYVNVTDNVGQWNVVAATFVVASDDRPSGPVVIDSDDSLAENATLLGWSGDGTKDHPYKVGKFSPSLKISNTQLYVDICDMNKVANITLVNVKHVAIRNVEIAPKTIWSVNGFEDLTIDHTNMTSMQQTTIDAATHRCLVITNGKDLNITNNVFNYTLVDRIFGGIVNLMTITGVDNANISGNKLSTTSVATVPSMRGLVFQGTNSVIEGNIMNDLSGGAILASGTDLLISNNQIARCGWGDDYMAVRQILPAIDVSGTNIMVLGNTLVLSKKVASNIGVGPGISASGSVNVSSNTISKFRVNLFNDGAVAWNNTIIDCRTGMSGNGVMRHNTIISAIYGVAPVSGAIIEGNDIVATESGVYSEFYYSTNPTTKVLDLANDVSLIGNHIAAKVGINIDDKNAVDTDIISGLNARGNTFDCTVAVIRIAGASLIGSEISGNLFNGAGITLVNVGSSTFDVNFRGNTFSGVVADSLISFVKPSGAVTPLTIVKMSFNGTVFGLNALNEGCRLSVDGSEWITIGSDGLTLLDPGFIADGPRTLRGELKDNNGNTFVAVINIVYDSEAPVIEISSPSSGGINPLSEVTVKWTVHDDGTGNLEWVHIKIDNAVFSDVDISGTGNYEETFFSLAEGTHTVTIEAMDDKGHMSTVTRTFIIDTSAPTVTIDSPSTGSVFATGSVLVKFNATDAGSGVNKVEVRIDGGAWMEAMGNEHLFSGLGEGTHTIAVRVTDFTRLQGTATITVTVDTTAPALTIESPTANAILNSGEVSVTFNTDAERIDIKVDNGAWETIPNEAYPLSLNGGTHTVALRAYDAVGNMNETSAVFVIDTSAPNVSIASPVDGAVIAASVLDVYFSAGDSNGIQSLILNVDGTDIIVTGLGSYRLLDLGEGEHVLVLTATDRAGLESQATVSFTVALDDVLPTLAILAPVNGAILASSALDIYFSAQDSSGIQSLVLTVDGTNIDVTGLSSHRLTGLADGTHVLVLTATDGAGNTDFREISFVVDTVKPAVAISSPASNALLGNKDVTVQFSVTGATVIQVSVDGGVWSAIPNQAYSIKLNDGAHVVVIRAFDAAGNTNATSATFVVDTSAPVVSLISPAVDTTVSKADLDVFFAVSDLTGVQTLTLSVDGSAAVDVTGVRAYHLAYLSDGTHTLTFRAVDELGNEATYAFSVQVSVPVTVSGRILDADGKPLAGAKVTIGSVSTTTDDDGRYSLQTVRGEKNMTVTAEGMKEMTQSLDLSSEMSSVSMALKSSSGDGSGGSTALIIGAVVVIAAAMLAVGMLVLRKKGKL